MFDILYLKNETIKVNGFYCDGLSAGLKADNELDIGFIYSDTLCDTSFVWTANKFKASPIEYVQNKGDFQTNFILINSKNANALTGNRGLKDIDDIFDSIAFEQNLTNPIMSSTGVIGVRLPKDKIVKGANKFNLKNNNLTNLSNAIMTTDKYPKVINLKVDLQDGNSFNICGIAKGAGMINPNLATMLCFIVSDADVPKDDMSELLKLHIQTTFNAISVDGDTSTNDTIMLLSNHKSKAYDKEAFSEGLRLVMEKLSHDIIKDGEGASKVVAFEVVGAKSKNDAIKCAKALSNSLLVKTAIFGQDPNWGRIASTIGASGIECDIDKLSISFEDICVFDKAEIKFDKEVELQASKILLKDEFKIICDIGVGKSSFRAFGCDLGYEYVKINADYRT